MLHSTTAVRSASAMKESWLPPRGATGLLWRWSHQAD